MPCPLPLTKAGIMIRIDSDCYRARSNGHAWQSSLRLLSNSSCSSQFGSNCSFTSASAVWSDSRVERMLFLLNSDFLSSAPSCLSIRRRSSQRLRADSCLTHHCVLCKHHFKSFRISRFHAGIEGLLFKPSYLDGQSPFRYLTKPSQRI